MRKFYICLKLDKFYLAQNIYSANKAQVLHLSRIGQILRAATFIAQNSATVTLVNDLGGPKGMHFTFLSGSY